jgi:hypothetical protein
MPFDKAAQMFEEILGVQTNEETVRHLTERMEGYMEAAQAAESDAPSSQESNDQPASHRCALSADGVMISLVKKQWAETRTVAIGEPQEKCTANGEREGCVAKNLRRMLRTCNPTFLFSLDSHSKQTGDECHLLYGVSFFYAADLTLSEHVHRFISLHGSPRGLERKEAHPKLDEPFHEAMVLLDEVVEVFALPQFATVWHHPLRF